MIMEKINLVDNSYEDICLTIFRYGDMITFEVEPSGSNVQILTLPLVNWDL